MIPVAQFTQTMAVLTMIAQLLSLALVVGLVTGFSQKLIKQFKVEHKHFLIAAYAVALVSTLGSLYYSDVAGYTPCKMCWYQRILMYPQTILYLVALVRNDKKIGEYGIALSVVGGLLALYHYLLQIGIITVTSCSTVGYSISCSENFGTTFGYITIPMMALSGFVLISLVWITQIKFLASKKKQ